MKRKVCLTVFALVGVLAAKSQKEWVKAMQEPGANFYAIREQFYAKHKAEIARTALPEAALRLKKLPSKDDETDYEMIKFRRWEWYWSSRVHPDGRFPSPAETYNEYQRAVQATATTPISRIAAAPWSNISRTANSGGYWGMGRTSSIAFHPADSNTFWVTAPMGGVWKTTDAGATYKPQGDQLPYLGAGSIVVDRIDPNTLYLCTGDHVGDNSLGIFKSTDGGDNWEPTGLSTALDQQYAFYNLVQHTQARNTLLAASNRGLFRTTNGGNKWQQISDLRCTDVEYSTAVGNVVYAALATKIYKSTNGGNAFNQVLDMGPMSATATVRIAVTKADANRVIAWSRNGVWVSDDAGETWTKKTFPPAGYMESMLISPTNPDVLYAGMIDIYQSADAGTTWTKATNWWNQSPAVPEVHADHRNLAYSPNTNAIFSLNDGGVDKYNEAGNSWTRHSNGLVIAQYYSAASSATNPNLIGVGSQDNGGSRRDNNLQWQNTNGGDAGTQAIDPTNPNVCYSNYNPSPSIIRTTNNWRSTVDVRPTDNPLTSWWVIPYTLDPNNANSLVVGYHAIYRSNNRGTNWTKISPNFTNPGNYWEAFRAIAVAPANSNQIYASRPRTLYFTSDIFCQLRPPSTDL